MKKKKTIRGLVLTLHPCNIVQQIKAKGWLIYDPQNLCIYVDYRNGTSALILSALKQYKEYGEQKTQKPD